MVCPSDSKFDRSIKNTAYAEAGIPCYWRVELRSWKEHFGPLPAIVVGLLNEGAYQQRIYAAGRDTNIPLAIGRGADDWLTVTLDSADLMGPRK